MVEKVIVLRTSLINSLLFWRAPPLLSSQMITSPRLLCRPLSYLCSPSTSTDHPVATRHSVCCVKPFHRHGSTVSRTVKRYEKLGIGPDGKPLPMPNNKRVHPKMYKVLLVNQDGSTYTVRHRYPHRIIKLPLDLSTLTPEQLAERERVKQMAKARVYVEEEDLEDDGWDQDRYRNLT